MCKNLISFVYITAGAWFNHFPNEKWVGLVTNLQKQNRTVATLKATGHFRVPLFKRGKEQNLSCEICVRIKNHFHIDSMVLHWASLWNWGLGQLENGLLVSYAVVIWVVTQRPPQRKVMHEPDSSSTGTSAARERSAKYWSCSRAPLATGAWCRCHSWLSKGNLHAA